MTSLLLEYNKQLSLIFDQIRSVFCKQPSKDVDLKNIDKLLKECAEYLEQYELEIDEIPSAEDRGQYREKLSKFKSDFKYFSQQMKTSAELLNRDNLLGEDNSSLKQSLATNTQSLERQNYRLDDAYSLSLETERIGSDILNDLSHQRETMQRSLNNLQSTNENLGVSSRLLSSIIKKRSWWPF